MNYKGRPDTIILDPLLVYDMEVHTVPPVRVDSVVIHPGTHTHIGASTPQGQLELRSTTRQNTTVSCIIKPHGENEILHVQEFGTTQRYISGIYDLEILTLPRIFQDGVKIDASSTTTIAIPPPGMVTLQTGASGYGSIFVQRENSFEWVTDLSESSDAKYSNSNRVNTLLFSVASLHKKPDTVNLKSSGLVLALQPS